MYGTERTVQRPGRILTLASLPYTSGGSPTTVPFMKFFDTPPSARNSGGRHFLGTSVIRSRANYFAYGSNMLTARLRERVPSAAAIGIGQLVGHALRWDKRSWQDGSGKCDAEATSRNDDVVWGVLFELDPEDKPALDKAEGVGAGYLEKTVNVLTEAGLVTAVTYCANDKDATLRPYHWYKALVIAGAREHGLPASYRSGLELVVTVSEHTTAGPQAQGSCYPG